MEMKDVNRKVAVVGIIAVVLLSLAVFAVAENNRGGMMGLNSGLGAGARIGIEEKNGGSTDLEAQSDADSESSAGAGIDMGIRIRGMKERYDNMKERMEDAREKFTEAKIKIREGAKDFNSLKERFNHSSMGEKGRLRAELKSSAQHVLLNQVNAILNHLDAIGGSNVEPADFNEGKAFFEAKQQLLMDTNMSQEDLIKTSAEIRQYWHDHKVEFERDVGANLNAKFGRVIGNAESFSAKVEGRIDALKAEGKDTNLLESGLAKLKADINLFREASAQVQADLNAAIADGNSASADAKVREAHELLRAMHRQLQVDFKLMKSLFNATRQLEVSANLSAEIRSELAEAIAESNASIGGGQ